MPRINYASSMMVEDHLNLMMSKIQGKLFKTYNNKLLPEAYHTCFGNFPKDMMPVR